MASTHLVWKTLRTAPIPRINGLKYAKAKASKPGKNYAEIIPVEILLNVSQLF